MKIILCTAAVSLVIGASVFTTQKVVQAEARKTRNSMPGMLNNPLDDGESLVSKVAKLNSTLESINKRLTRLEEISTRDLKMATSEIKVITTGTKEEVDRLSLRVNTLSKEQAALSDLPGQLRTIDANMRIAISAIDSKPQGNSAPPEEILKAMDWMVQKIDDIDSYFPPLYNFLGAVYDDNAAAAADYPSIDLRLNEMIIALNKLQEDAAVTRKLVTPYTREPTTYPRPFEEREEIIVPRD